MRKAATEMLGNWNTSMSYKPMAARFRKVDAKNEKIDTPDKANAQFEAGVRFQLSENDPDSCFSCDIALRTGSLCNRRVSRMRASHDTQDGRRRRSWPCVAGIGGSSSFLATGSLFHDS